MFETLLNPQSVKIINSLLGGDKSLDELSSILEVSKPGLKQKYLDRLERIGLIEKTIIKTKVGRQARYSLKPFTAVLNLDPATGSAICFSDRSPIDIRGVLLQQVDPDFRGDVKKFIDAMDRSILSECTIILFGSVAVGKGTKKSDIDLLILKKSWDEGKEEVDRAEESVSLKVEHQLSPVTMTTEQFLSSDTIFLKEIKKDGIVIWGSLEMSGDLWHRMKRYSSISI